MYCKHARRIQNINTNLAIGSKHDGSYEASFNSHSDTHVDCVKSMRQHTAQLSITEYYTAQYNTRNIASELAAVRTTVH